jgi:hypothetical protein
MKFDVKIYFKILKKKESCRDIFLGGCVRHAWQAFTAWISEFYSAARPLKLKSRKEEFHLEITKTNLIYICISKRKVYIFYGTAFILCGLPLAKRDNCPSLSLSLSRLSLHLLPSKSIAYFFSVQNSKLSHLHKPPLRLPDSLTLTRQQRFKPLKDSLR